MPEIENPSPAAEISPAPPVQTENPPESVQAPPPATAIVVTGEIKSEREIQLEKKLAFAEDRAKKAEFIAAERERDVQSLKQIAAMPEPVKMRGRWWMPIIGNEE